MKKTIFSTCAFCNSTVTPQREKSKNLYRYICRYCEYKAPSASTWVDARKFWNNPKEKEM